MDKSEERAQKCAYHLGQLAGLGLLKEGEYSLIRNRTITHHESYIEIDK
tara:strand:- start:506 stop:652 length:147 start_codon:yes stop_codon:yes gene_type:complete